MTSKSKQSHHHIKEVTDMNINFDFESLKDKAKDLAQTGVAKAKELTDTGVSKGKELTEIGKLKVQNASEQENIKKAYLELGKLYYAERGAAPEAGYASLCAQIADSQAKIDYNNERISDIKSAGKLSDEEVEDVSFEDIDAEDAAAEPPAEDAPAQEDAPQDNGPQE
jgi:hypothetical protein